MVSFSESSCLNNCGGWEQQQQQKHSKIHLQVWKVIWKKRVGNKVVQTLIQRILWNFLFGKAKHAILGGKPKLALPSSLRLVMRAVVTVPQEYFSKGTKLKLTGSLQLTNQNLQCLPPERQEVLLFIHNLFVHWTTIYTHLVQTHWKSPGWDFSFDFLFRKN